MVIDNIISWCLVHSIFWDIDGNDVEQLVLVLREMEVEKSWKLISEKKDFQVFWNYVPARVILHPSRILFELTF